MFIVDAIMGVVKPVLDKVLPDAKDRLEAENMVYKSILTLDLAQIEVNKQEAASDSIFVAGWRPFVGWVCGAGLAYQFLAEPMLTWAAMMAGVVDPPRLDMETLLTVLAGMLGMSTLRTFEKHKGVAR